MATDFRQEYIIEGERTRDDQPELAKEAGAVDLDKFDENGMPIGGKYDA